MLLQFAVENYLSFRDRAVLSMLANPRVTHEPGQVLEGPGGKQVLRAAAVYGANGSGKSNLFKALKVFREMAIRGTRGDAHLPVVPFKLDPARPETPTHFEVEICAEGKHYSYGFETTTKRIESEWLYEIDNEERLLFEREPGDDKPRIKIGDALTTDPKRRGFLEYVAEGTRQNQPFLAEAGERNVSELGAIRQAIKKWTLIAPDSHYTRLLDRLEENDNFRTFVGLVLRDAGTGIHDLRVVSEQAPREMADVMALMKDDMGLISNAFAGNQAALRFDDKGGLELRTLLSVHSLPDGSPVELDMNDESDGTRRLLHLTHVVHLLEEGGADPLFAIDELERSLHPLLTRMLLQLFFARAGAGSQGARIIFTTHDTNLLDHRILSRDSIWLMEKDVRGGSVMYPLSELDQGQLDDLEEQGKGLEKSYLRGRFGAIPFFGSLKALGFRKEDLE